MTLDKDHSQESQIGNCTTTSQDVPDLSTAAIYSPASSIVTSPGDMVIDLLTRVTVLSNSHATRKHTLHILKYFHA